MKRKRISVDGFDTHDFDLYLGSRLKDCRKRQKLTLHDVADILGISFQQLQKYEVALSRVPPALLYRLTEIYKISVESIFADYSRKNLRSRHITDKFDEKPANILVVEDNPDDEKITQRALSGIANLNIMFVHDCNQATRLLKTRSNFDEFRTPDLIFLDYYMPKRDGLSMLRELKQNYRFVCVPIIMLTNNINTEAMIKAYQYGASGYICKSFEFSKFKNDLVNSINYWIKTIVPPSRVIGFNLY